MMKHSAITSPADGKSTDARVTELLDAYLAAAAGGHPPDRDAFLAEHAEVADALRVALVGFDFVRRAGDELAAAADGATETLPHGTLGDFRLVREVGRGGMGVVYEAEQMSLGRRVALKVLPFAAVLDDRQLQRFKHEAQAAALLHHTNIVPVYAVGTERGVHYYAMQLVLGRTLADVIAELKTTSKKPSSGQRARNRRPSPRAAKAAPDDPPSSSEALALSPQGTTETPDYCRAIVRLGVQAADALDHAHENGVIHRDVKPANLMIDAKGHLWIADFGLARSRANPGMTMTGTMLGTLRYMSPEQALAKRVPVDHRTDVYSLGVTLMEALTLEPAFPGDDPHRVLQDIAVREPQRPQRLNHAISPALETILLKSVAKDPETRYATAREMADDLRRYLDDKPVLARRPPVLDRVSMWARRHRAAVVAAAAILVVAVVALAVSTVTIAAEKQRADDANRKSTAALDETRRSAARAESALEESKQSAARAETALAESKKNAERAEANFAKAREAVDQMLTRVADERLKGVPAFASMRRQLLEDAVSFYRGFLADRGDDSAVRLETALAFHRLGKIHTSMGQRELALQMQDQARALLLTLCPEDGPWVPAMLDLVDVENARAGAIGGRKSIEVLERAVTLAERNVKEHPEMARAGMAVTRAHRNLGRRLIYLEEYAKARDALGRAIACQETLVAQFPLDPLVREEAAKDYDALEGLEYDLGRMAQAEDAAKKVLAQYVSADTLPADSDAFDRRAETLIALGQIYLRTDRYDEAERAFKAARDAKSREAAEFPQFPYSALHVAECSGTRSALLWRLGRSNEAEADYADAMKRYELVLRRFEDMPKSLATTANALAEFARTLEDAGRKSEAEAPFRRALDVQRVLAADPSADPGRKRELAQTLSDMVASLDDRLGREEVVSMLRESAKLGDEITAAPDASSADFGVFAYALNNLAATLETSGDLRGAVDASQRAVRAFRVVVAQFEAGAGNDQRLNLGGCLAACGHLLQESGSIEEAQKAVDEGVEILESLARETPGDPKIAHKLANALRAAGNIETARGRPDGAWIFEALARAHLGESKVARELYEKAAAWMAEHGETDGTLLRRRDETAKLLGIPNGR